jgi:uncharacterized membrane protein
MTKNVGQTDRIVRILVAVVIAVLLFTNTVAMSSTLGIILAVVGVIFLFTGATSWCALYSVVGASTCKA